MATEDLILDELKLLNLHFTRYIGNGVGYAGTSGVGSTASASARKSPLSLHSLRNASDKLTTSMRLLEGSAHDLRSSLTGLLQMTAIGGALAGVFHYLIDSTMRLVGTYNKLSDIGQLFQGSLIEMQRQAADAGLSLQEYSEIVQKHSTLAAVMNMQQDQTGRSLNALQKSVRDTLKPMGFYGMSLSEVTNATADVADNFRMSGWLYRTTADDQRKAVGSFVEELTALAMASGKSRQKIMEDANRAMRDTGALATLALTGNARSAEALMKTTATLSSMGDLGPQLSTLLGEAVRTGSAALTQQGQQMINLGMSDAVSMIDDLARKVRAGYVPTIEDQIQIAGNMTKVLQSHMPSLQALSISNPEAAKFIAGIGQLYGIKWDDVYKKMKDTQDALAANPYTQLALTFESTFHEITAQFRQGLYESVLRSFVPDPADQGKYDRWVKDLKESLFTLGTEFGKLLVAVSKLEPLFVDFVRFLTWGAEKLGSLRDWLTGKGMGEGWATGLVAALPIILWKVMKNMIFRNIHIRSALTTVTGGGGIGSMLGGLGGGGGFRGAWAARGIRGVAGVGARVLGRGLAGAAFAWIGSSLMEALPDFKGKDSINAAIQGAGYGASIGGLFGPLGMAAGAIIGGVGGLLYENFDSIKDAIPGIISAAWGNLTWFVGAIGEGLKASFLFVKDGIPAMIKDAWGEVTWLGQAILDGIKGVFTGAWDYAKKIVTNVATGGGGGGLVPGINYDPVTGTPILPIAPTTPAGATPPSMQTVQKNIAQNQAEQNQQLSDQAQQASDNSTNVLQDMKNLLDRIRGHLEDQSGLLKLNNDAMEEANRRFGSLSYIQ